MVKTRRPNENFELEEVDVAIVAESTYPFLKGGVSAVVHDIITNNPELTFGIIHIAWDSESPTEYLYDVPGNVLWVDMIYLSMAETSVALQKLFDSTAELNGHSPNEVAKKLMYALDQVTRDNPQPLWDLYDEAVNPLTRSYRLWPVFPTKAMMQQSIKMVGNAEDMSVGTLFWQLRDFFSLAFAITDRVQPPAKVYHAHTTGYASVIAACGARQHNGSFLLTEHNLYVRDTVNTLLDRRMDLPITRTSHLELPKNTVEYFWTRWWVEMGAWLYPSADHITYLYPLAITEAEALGGIPSKSEVLPNGMEWDDFSYGRLRRREALDDIVSGRKQNWRFACIARVVPIKGIIELIDSVAHLVRMGYTNFTVDVLGPTDHIPEYYRRCVAYAEKIGVSDRVVFRGTVKVRDVIHDYDALVLASFNEGQPIVVLESMACGLPVVGTNVGGMDQVVRDPLPDLDGGEVGPCGILVEPGDSEGLAKGIATLMGSGEAYREWYENALVRLQGTFLMPVVMSRYNAIYRRLGAASTPASLPNADLARGEDDVREGGFLRRPKGSQLFGWGTTRNPETVRTGQLMGGYFRRQK